jgi:hypothetical protein
MKTDQYGLFRSDIGYIEGIKSISDRYVPHTTDDVVALTEAASAAFDDNVTVKCGFRRGHYVTLGPSDTERREIANKKDGVFPRFMLRAGFDGKSFGATLGYFRDLCANLSMMRTISSTTVSIRHTSGLRDAMDELVETFQALKGSWDDLTGAMERMQQRQVNMTEYIDQIFGVPKDDASTSALTRHENRTAKIFRRLRREYQTLEGRMFPDDNNVNVWLAYNAVQGYVQHDASRKNGLTNDFERIISSSNDPKVRAAEELARDLAA